MRKVLSYILLISFVFLNAISAAVAGTTERLFTRQVYQAGFTVVPAASATDVVTIYGFNAGKVIISSLSITGTQTTAGKVLVNLVKRSAANTGGTSTAQTAVAMNSKNIPAQASVAAYTANPSALGTSVGVFDSQYVFIPSPGSVAPGDNAMLYQESAYGEPVVLNSATEGISVNLTGTTVTGGSLSFTIQWEELLN